MDPILEFKNVTKIFPGVIANDHISFSLQKGEILALLGENGAGKSTLMNVLYGLYQPDEGEIYINGEKVSFHSPSDAIQKGIGMVHQHFMLVPVFNVAENVMLGKEDTKFGGILDQEKTANAIRKISRDYKFEVNPYDYVKDLPVGVQQRVEIIKLLFRGAEILIFDEPTAVLTPQEADDLFVILRSLAKEGKSIIFITHKLREVLDLADRIIVLRLGKVVGETLAENASQSSLASMMVGREVFLKFDKPEIPPGEVILSVENLSAVDRRGLPALKSVNFEIHRNEIFGIAGVDGNGQTELSETLSGLLRATSGKMTISGNDATNRTPFEILNMKVAVIPPDRQKMGLLMNFAVDENLIAKSFWRVPFSRNGFLKKKVIDEFSDRVIKDFNIRTPGPKIQVKLLSGGNQQKVVIARELSEIPDLLIASQPTRGLDIAATEYVHKQLLAARQAGAAILFISTELEEILSLSDRIAVMYEGEIMGIVPGKGADLLEIGEMMAGVRRMNHSNPSTEKEAEAAQ